MSAVTPLISNAFCPFPSCLDQRPVEGAGPVSGRVIRKGSYVRQDDQVRVENFCCKGCGKRFSSATHAPEYRQKKRSFNSRVSDLLASTGSLRRTALLLKLNRKTVERKLEFLGGQAQLARLAELAKLAALPEDQKINAVQFDEMQTVEKTKCLPLSIPLIVQAGKDRRILGFRVASMPANGLLAEFSRKKYGYRRDERKAKTLDLFREVGPALSSHVEILSDEKPQYPAWIKQGLPQAKHQTVKGQRGCIAGQGELKKIGFDPLFNLNHTAAMLRANVNRLIRKTWCVTQRPDRLIAHIELYIQFHNQRLLEG